VIVAGDAELRAPHPAAPRDLAAEFARFEDERSTRSVRTLEDTETKEALRALGYVDEGEPSQ